MTAISRALSGALLHFVWQGTAIALLLWIVLLLLRRREPGTRYTASCAALALMAALPAATILILYDRPVSLSASIAFVIPPAARAVSSPPAEWLAPTQQWILPLWALGVALFAIRFSLAWRHVATLRRAANDAEIGLADAVSGLARRMRVAAPVRVLVSKLADAPSVVGWLRPTILLPAAALAGLDMAQLEAILAHELAHIRRHDYLVNMLQTIVETLLFYHPAVWWVSSRMRHERELCCDDLAVRHCGDAIGYARALTRLERIRAVPEPAVAANGGALLYRIQRLTGAVRECAPSRLPVVLAVLAVALSVPMAVHRAGAQQQSAPATNVFSGTPPTTHVFLGRPRGITFDSIDPQGDSITVEYPEEAVRQGITGAVLVEATLDADGRATDARVVTGPIELRKAALRGVLEGSFANTTAGEVRQVTLNFGQKELAAERARLEQRAGAVTLSDGRATVTHALPLTESQQSELEQARKQLADLANQPEVEAQLKAEIAAQERNLAAVQRDLMAREAAAQDAKGQQAAVVESFLRGELAKTRKKLADAANEPGIELQLKAQLAEQERQLVAAQVALKLEAELQAQLAAAQRDLQSKAEDANLAAAAANGDLTHDQRKVGAMNVLLDSIQRQLANKRLVYTDNHPEVRALKQRIAEMQHEIMGFVAGRKLVRIDGDALPSGFHLPVKLGDTLTQDSMNAVVAAVDAFDSNLEVAFFPLNEQEAAIRIVRRQ
jgi:beta-lactamase regulating signal transducer with metallopeptidase domain